MCSKNLIFWIWPSIDPYNQGVQSIHQSQPTTLSFLPRTVWQEQLCFKIQVSLDHLRAQLVTWTNKVPCWKGGESKEWWGHKGMEVDGNHFFHGWKESMLKGDQVITCHCQGFIATARGYCNDRGMACHGMLLYPEVDSEDLTGCGSFQRSDHCL